MVIFPLAPDQTIAQMWTLSAIHVLCHLHIPSHLWLLWHNEKYHVNVNWYDKLLHCIMADWIKRPRSGPADIVDHLETWESRSSLLVTNNDLSLPTEVFQTLLWQLSGCLHHFGNNMLHFWSTHIHPLSSDCESVASFEFLHVSVACENKRIFGVFCVYLVSLLHLC